MVPLTTSILSLSLGSLFHHAIVNICAVPPGEKRKERKRVAFNCISLLILLCHVDIEAILPERGGGSMAENDGWEQGERRAPPFSGCADLEHLSSCTPFRSTFYFTWCLLLRNSPLVFVMLTKYIWWCLTLGAEPVWGWLSLPGMPRRSPGHWGSTLN